MSMNNKFLLLLQQTLLLADSSSDSEESSDDELTLLECKRWCILYLRDCIPQPITGVYEYMIAKFNGGHKSGH